MKHWRSHIYVAVCMWKCIFSIGIDFYSIDYTLTLGRNCTPHTGHSFFYSYRPLCTTIIYLSNHLTFFSFPFVHFELCKNSGQHIFFSSLSWLLLYFIFDDYYTEFIDDYMMTECVYHVYRYWIYVDWLALTWFCVCCCFVLIGVNWCLLHLLWVLFQ